MVSLWLLNYNFVNVILWQVLVIWRGNPDICIFLLFWILGYVLILLFPAEAW